VVVGRRSLVVGARAAHNGLADPANPIVFFTLRVGVQQVTSFGRGYFKGVSLFGFEIGTLDGGAVRQVHHAVRSRVFVFAKEEFVALENEIAAAPFL